MSDIEVAKLLIVTGTVAVFRILLTMTFVVWRGRGQRCQMRRATRIEDSPKAVSLLYK